MKWSHWIFASPWLRRCRTDDASFVTSPYSKGKNLPISFLLRSTRKLMDIMPNTPPIGAEEQAPQAGLTFISLRHGIFLYLGLAIVSTITGMMIGFTVAFSAAASGHKVPLQELLLQTFPWTTIGSGLVELAILGIIFKRYSPHLRNSPSSTTIGFSRGNARLGLRSALSGACIGLAAVCIMATIPEGPGTESPPIATLERVGRSQALDLVSLRTLHGTHHPKLSPHNSKQGEVCFYVAGRIKGNCS